MAQNRKGRVLFQPCRHRGFGASCHRCSEANRLEKIGTALKAKKSGKGWVEGMAKDQQRAGARWQARHPGEERPQAFSGWNAEHFLTEAKRLRTVDGKLEEQVKPSEGDALPAEA